MPGIPLTRSSSSASLKLWERQSKHSLTMAAATQSLMDQGVRRSDSSRSSMVKRKSFLRRSSSKSGRDQDRFSDDFSQACAGSISSQRPEESFEIILQSFHSKQRESATAAAAKKNPKAQARQLSSDRPTWRCLPSSFTHPGVLVPPVLTASSASEDSRQERFDQSFDYAFDTIIWDKTVPDCSLVDTTFASNSSASSSPPPALPPPPPPTTSTTPPKKSKSKWRLFHWKSRRKVQRSQSFQERSSHHNPSEEQPEEELPDWEAHMEGEQVECEYRGDVTVQDLFATAPDSPAIQRVSSWGMEQIGLEKKAETDPLPNATVGVMELGQYAREMQSKIKPTPPSPIRKRPQVTSLLCALPLLGGRSSKANHNEEEDFDFGDDEGSWDDDNSYLAVSYTGEGAQLVMTQSAEDREHEKSRQESSPQEFVAKERNDRDVSPVEDAPEEPPPPTETLSLPKKGKDELQFLGENRILSYATTNSNKRFSTLGASFPHPAAQMREEMSVRRLRHPSTLSIPEEDMETKYSKQSTQTPFLVDEVAETPLRKNASMEVEKEVHGKVIFHHYKAPISRDSSGRLSSVYSSVYTPSPIESMRPNFVQRNQETNPATSRNQSNPLLCPSQENPPACEDSTVPPFRYYACPTATNMPPAYPTCTSRSAPRWLTQSPEVTWDHTTARTLDSRSRSLSTLSQSEFPLQERQGFVSSTDLWDLYQPIRDLAKEVNETLCENLYPKTEQPASVPFDELQMDDRLRQCRPPWTKVVRTKSSSSSDQFGYYSRFDRDRENDRPRRPQRVIAKDMGMERRPDPPTETLNAQRDTRRQLL